MTYQDAFRANRRTISLGDFSDSTLLRIATALALFAVLSAALIFSNPPKTLPSAGDDWHGNVAASGYIR